MYRIYKTLEKYNEYTENGQKLTSGDLYIITDDKKVILQTNDIDGEFAVYDMIEPSGSIEITENAENIDVAQYASATVNVAGSGGNPLFTQFIERNDFTTFEIPEGTTKIGGGAFRGFSNLEEVTIPEGVISIDNEAFQSCSSLTSVTIPNSVTSIGNQAFYQCSGLTSVTIPSGVTSIDYAAFNGCTGLTSVTIPNGVTSIAQMTFYGCTGLTSITIPDGVTSIGTSAFYNCTGLTSVTIGSGVTSIGDSTFSGCSGLESITIEATTPPTLTNYNTFNNTNNCPIYVPAASVSAYKAATTWSSLASRIQAIPLLIETKYNVTDTSAATTLLSSTSNITQLKIDGVIQPSVVSTYQFNTTGEHDVEYYLTGNNIGQQAFMSCSSLTEVIIPDGVTTISNKAFMSCSGLTSVTIGSGVTSIGNQAFLYCSSLTSINIPNSVTSIGIYTFKNCSSLTSITIPSSVTSIGQSTFEGCSSLTSIVIPSSVTSIDAEAFYNCNSLTSITIEATTPPTLSNINAFGNTNNCPIYVPAASVSAYKAATNWNSLSSRIQAIPAQ